MRLLFLAMTMLLPFSYSNADQDDDLATFAKEVPIKEVDAEVIALIKNETNEETSGLKSHYTLALYEHQRTGTKWYILDGYYELASGKILFLDFQYYPQNKSWWPIENYKRFIPSSTKRFLLKVEEKCNPYKRDLIGIVSFYKAEGQSVDSIISFLSREFDQPPGLIVGPSDIYVIDHTRDGWGINPNPQFTLKENFLITKFQEVLGISPGKIQSERDLSNENVKQTYVGVTESCK